MGGEEGSSGDGVRVEEGRRRGCRIDVVWFVVKDVGGMEEMEFGVGGRGREEKGVFGNVVGSWNEGIEEWLMEVVWEGR